MSKGHSKIANALGKALSERRKAIVSEPLPARLRELLRLLSESEDRSASAREGR
jgi:hypothetical protein